jgi:hypothetical protein
MHRFLLLICAVALSACAPAIAVPTNISPLATQPANATPTPETPDTQPLPPTTPIPNGVLIDLVREGGFDGNLSHLTIYTNGNAHLEGRTLEAPVDWTIPADTLTLLQDMLANPDFAALPYDPNTDLGCADCYLYTINAQTPKGVKTLSFDDADLSIGQNTSPLYQGIAATLSGLIANAPNPQLPPKGSVDLADDLLVSFHREGGIAFNIVDFTIDLNGNARLEDSNLKAPVTWTIADDQLAGLHTILSNPALVTMQDKGGVMCNDCYMYTIKMRTPEGVILIKGDDADLMNGELPEMVSDILIFLNTVKDSAPQSI